MNMEQLNAYELLEERHVEELNSTSYLLKHKKTKARIFLLSNDDKNKVFYIGFKTPPKDSTGVAHIVEHTVLCGSDKYPVKDPFIELAKGSLNTFLNAMTYSDKTVYPVASCNDKDFQNLMDVYLDAVFHPNIYHERKIFEQEGWHYEMEGLEDDLTINGVVYNEMKGAFSAPDDVFESEIMKGLYPNSPYGVESGGDPEEIPNLSYEGFLAFHQKYYHPSNSYIYLYGDMDMEEKLRYIDEEYLSKYDYLEVDSKLPLQKPFEKVIEKELPYSIMENESDKDNTYLSYSVSIKDNLDAKQYVAYDILDYALCSAPGAPLKQALIDAGIGHDAYSAYESGILQPYFSIVAKGANPEQKDAFLEIIDKTLKDLALNGVDKKALYAGINYYEFRHREADYGSYPKGLMWGLDALDSWLYDDTKPLLHLEANHTYEELKTAIEEGYFETLIKEDLLENKHKLILILKPQKGLTVEKDNQLAQKLSALKDSLSKEERLEIVENTKALKEYQESEDAEEDLKKIPLLTREDIGKTVEPYVNEERFVDDTLVLFHNIFTNGIGYLRILFDMNQVSADLYPYIGLLKSVWGLMNTEQYAYGDLFNEINIVTGGMSSQASTYVDARDNSKYRFMFEIKAKTLYQNKKKTFDLIKEIIMNSKYDDAKRLKELIDETKSHLQSDLLAAGHSVALIRSLSYHSVNAAIAGMTGGIPYYRLLEDLSEHFDDKKDEIVEKLNLLVKSIFKPENMMVDYTADEEGYEGLEDLVVDLKNCLYTDAVEGKPFAFTPDYKQEGFMSASQVQYVCRSGNYKKAGLEYTGALRALRVMMGYEYLWNNVRVKGGAYGCMCSFTKTGDSYFVSYRDPNLEKTIDVYEKAAEAIRNYEADERTITQYIIGAVSTWDTPMTPATKGSYSLGGYLSHHAIESIQKERDELLATTADTLRGLADYIDAFMKDGAMCVVGSEEKIKEQRDLFKSVEYLVH